MAVQDQEWENGCEAWYITQLHWADTKGLAVDVTERCHCQEELFHCLHCSLGVSVGLSVVWRWHILMHVLGIQ